jgi:hypothetical protein
LKEKEENVTLEETSLNDNEKLTNRHIERIQKFIKHKYKCINGLYAPSVINLDLFRPIIMENTLFI